MSLPVTVPFTFGNATTTQSLSSLDTNFTTITNSVNGLTNGASQINVAAISATGTANATTFLRGDGAWANVSSGGGSIISNGTSNVSITSANGSVSIATNGNNAVYVDTSGNVGIGTTSPNTKIQVNKTSTSAFTGTSFGAMLLTDPNSTLNYFTNLDFTTSSVNLPIARIGMGYTSAGSTLNFGTSVTYENGITNTAMTIDPFGNLLVNSTTTAPGGATYSGQISVVNAGGSTKTGINVCTTASTSRAIEFQYTAFGVVGSITTSTTTTAYNTNSDYRLKENVLPITTGLSTIIQLKPVVYNWVNDNSEGEGFIAHELQEIIPHAVIGKKDAVDDKGKPIYQGVDYSKIVVHLVAAIKELSAKNDALEARLVALESK